MRSATSAWDPASVADVVNGTNRTADALEDVAHLLRGILGVMQRQEHAASRESPRFDYNPMFPDGVEELPEPFDQSPNPEESGPPPADVPIGPEETGEDEGAEGSQNPMVLKAKGKGKKGKDNKGKDKEEGPAPK